MMMFMFELVEEILSCPSPTSVDTLLSGGVQKPGNIPQSHRLTEPLLLVGNKVSPSSVR